MSMVVHELREPKEETKEEPQYISNYCIIMRSQNKGEFNIFIQIGSDKWVMLDDETITDSLSWDEIKYFKATILFYSKA